MSGHHFSLLGLMSAAVFTLSMAGCGGSVGPAVKGTVTYADGTPVTVGEVQFVGERFSAVGPINPDGTYTMGSMRPGDGVPAGTYKVSLGGELQGSTYENKPPLIDSKYFNASTSGLVCEVEEGKAKEFPITVEKAQ